MRSLLKEKLPKAQHHSSLAPENVAVLGCAEEAGILVKSFGKGIRSVTDSSLLPCTPFDLWISVSSNFVPEIHVAIPPK